MSPASSAATIRLAGSRKKPAKTSAGFWRSSFRKRRSPTGTSERNRRNEVASFSANGLTATVLRHPT